MDFPRRAILFLVVCCCLGVNGGVVKRSDDVNTAVENLQVLAQQQAAVISSLQASQTALQNSQTALQNKFTALENKLSKAVAFTAMFSHDDINNGLPLSPHSTLIFDHVITNAGNGYSPTNGIFIAPIAGYYAFAITMMEPSAATHPDLALSIVKNGDLMDQVWVSNSPATDSESASTHCALHLALGDQIWIRQEHGDAVRGSVNTVFTGYLLHTK